MHTLLELLIANDKSHTGKRYGGVFRQLFGKDRELPMDNATGRQP
ncbi:hypothetical protein [Chitinophaga sp. LS1]|nr:hypothetical protein [Chitinophaga sp. LS1]WPV68852.1 hypothetical protein QQL36_08970 [Chitinophaga sp. LS1]